MDLKERVYSVLLVSASEKFNSALYTWPQSRFPCQDSFDISNVKRAAPTGHTIL